MNLLVLGANSDVAYAVARKFARREQAEIVLASRNLELLEKKVKDIRVRYNVPARALAFDAARFSTHSDFFRQLTPKPDGVVVAFGYLGDQASAQADFKEARQIIDTNFTGAVSILEIIASEFQRRGSGFIVGIGSVAGERGRQSNYLYGAAKGALSVYLSGLRNRLSRHNVQVSTILPGFIRTKMTAGLDLPALLTASPEQVASDIYQAVKNAKDTAYTPWFWRWIMAIIKTIPESIFKRMSL